MLHVIEVRVKSFLVTNECNLSRYIKTSVWFCIYYIHYRNVTVKRESTNLFLSHE